MKYFTNGRWMVLPENIDSIFIALNGDDTICIETKSGITLCDNSHTIYLKEDDNVIDEVVVDFSESVSITGTYNKEARKKSILRQAFSKLMDMYYKSING